LTKTRFPCIFQFAATSARRIITPYCPAAQTELPRGRNYNHFDPSLQDSASFRIAA